MTTHPIPTATPAAEVAHLSAAIDAVRTLCNSYTPTVPPLYSGPGMSEYGKGNVDGLSTMARAVLETLATALGEGPKDDDDCCPGGCPADPAEVPA